MRWLLLPLLLLPLLATPAHAVALPGGKANYVVSLGSLKAGSRDNWVRLGTYQFSTDGTVRARTYLWWQRYPTAREGTGAVPDGSCSTTRMPVGQTLVRNCEVRTAGGFMSDPGETRTGTFSVSGDVLHITWNIGQAWSEQWNIVLRGDGKLARIDFRSNTLADYGYAYGSNAALTTRRAMPTVRAFSGTLRHDMITWTQDKIAPTSGGAFNLGAYRTCTLTTWCLTYLQPNSTSACQAGGGCPYTGGGSTINDSSLQNYIVQVSSRDRRDTHWHWCTCLTRNSDGTDREKCYSGNSHVKPMMQIVDDDGEFHGWVGVDAAFYPSSDIAEPRKSDMLSVLRVSDFR
ncbi:hypothetical protein EDD27_3150 [Nonomuraea polychroma]|uniref:Uncharacterized protein n=1 Tax=Nonomuraea polychroma TaxID=46176 RepID=A0A438M4I8_9ACTN|nr:hypothetical protein [Nonomuraea polychroma]RVX40729.1 hypothetical protein EDD27_3150 [Nonomuraea polychroma]